MKEKERFSLQEKIKGQKSKVKSPNKNAITGIEKRKDFKLPQS